MIAAGVFIAFYLQQDPPRVASQARLQLHRSLLLDRNCAGVPGSCPTDSCPASYTSLYRLLTEDFRFSYGEF